jgi:hypothetical protein
MRQTLGLQEQGGAAGVRQGCNPRTPDVSRLKEKCSKFGSCSVSILVEPMGTDIVAYGRPVAEYVLITVSGTRTET